MKKILVYISVMAVAITACDERLEKLNTPEKSASEVGAETLFAQGLRESYDNMVSTSVNENIFRLYAQYWAQTTYPDESQYNLVTRTIPQTFWTNGYRDVLIDLKVAQDLLLEEIATTTDATSIPRLNNQLACVDLTMCYVYSIMVDTFGDIPYSEALDPDNLSPKYDDARDIYDDIIARINTSIANITVGAGGFSSSQDQVYGGDMSAWMKFANTLKLRMGMRLADVDPSASVSIVNSALSGGVFTSNADNASIAYSSSPNENPIYTSLVLSGRADYVAANTVTDKMNSLNDPRRYVFFRENLGADTFTGGTYGTANAYATSTQIGDLFHTSDLDGTIINYAEVQFLLAEAAARGGYSTSMTAEEYYNAGITASFDQWGVDDVATYLAQPEVAYTTADGGSGDFREVIGTQMWLALYNQGFEGWTTWRRLDMDVLNVPDGLTYEDIPVRFIYPLEEAQLNGDAVAAAASKIGGDVVQTKIFWDAF